jgi:membrane protease YdiL (CAAX protease family)
VLDRKPWKIWEAALLISPFILAVAFAHIAAQRADGASAPPEFSLDQFLLNSAIFVAYAACATGILMSKYDLNLNRALGFKTGPLSELLPVAFLIGFAVVPFMLILQMVCIHLFQTLNIPIESQQSIRALRSIDSPLEVAVFSIMPVIQAPLVEETLFRGILFPALRSAMPRWLAFLIPALLFAIVHANLLNMVPLFVFALLLTWQYEKTGNLLCPILTHAGFNLCNILIATEVIPLNKLFPQS